MIKYVISTLVYQLIKFIPSLKSVIISTIQSDPFIFNKSLETQFQALISDPLRQIHNDSPFSKNLVILIDGIDEYARHEDHANLIQTITNLSHKNWCQSS